MRDHAKKQKKASEWQALHIKFTALAREEQGRGAIVTKGALLSDMKQLLRAFWSYMDVTPPQGRWQYSGGLSESFLQRVRLCVSKAGLALSYPSDTDPAEDIWLDRLYCDLLENDTDELFAASEEGGTIVSICVASATFCSRLEQQALLITGLETSAESRKAESHSAQNSERIAQIPKSREEILRPILTSRGLSIHDWATKAGVDFHTANNYFRGDSGPYPSTLKKLAHALGIKVAKLPK